MRETTTLSIATRHGEIAAEEIATRGAQPGRPLIFLHGGAANLRSWDGVISELDNRCIAIDLPGHGKTSIDPIPFNQLDEVLQDSVHFLSVDQPVLIGHSFGGLAAVAAGSLSGDLYGGVIAVDPRLSSAEIRHGHSSLESALQELRDMTWPWLEVEDLDVEVERAVEQMTVRENMVQLRAMVRRGYRMQDNGTYVRFPRREDEIKGVQANWSLDVDEAYRTVGCPLALALAGENENRLAHRMRIVESLARRRGVDCLIFSCGHDIPGYKPGELAGYIPPMGSRSGDIAIRLW